MGLPQAGRSSLHKKDGKNRSMTFDRCSFAAELNPLQARSGSLQDSNQRCDASWSTQAERQTESVRWWPYLAAAARFAPRDGQAWLLCRQGSHETGQVNAGLFAPQECCPDDQEHHLPCYRDAKETIVELRMRNRRRHLFRQHLFAEKSRHQHNESINSCNQEDNA